MSTEFDPFFMEQQRNEFEAWRLVMSELRKRGMADVNRYPVGSESHPAGYVGKDAHLAEAIMAWGEELAELRRLDPKPEHGRNALQEKRDLVTVQWDKDEE